MQSPLSCVIRAECAHPLNSGKIEPHIWQTTKPRTPSNSARHVQQPQLPFLFPPFLRILAPTLIYDCGTSTLIDYCWIDGVYFYLNSWSYVLNISGCFLELLLCHNFLLHYKAYQYTSPLLSLAQTGHTHLLTHFLFRKTKVD